MAKRKNPSMHGRSGDPRRRAAEERARNEAQAEATPELEDEVAAALESGHPIEILMLASSLIASLESSSPRVGGASELPEAAEFVRMFLDSRDSDLQTFAWVIAQLLPDPAAAVEAELAAGAGVPEWLRILPGAEVVGAWQAADRLQDSSDVLISLRIGEADLTLLGLIDFNAGGALKDAFPVPAPLAAVLDAVTESGQESLTTNSLTTFDARAWLTDAIEAGRGVEPPFESDTWPQVRPLLEWALRRCPDGGRGWQRRRWTAEEIDEVVGQFASSPQGSVVAEPADRAVLVAALEALSQETSGDPLLLSAVRLELGLGYLWPTTLHFDLDRLLALPETLQAYVRWAHARRDIPADDTDAALAAIAHRSAEYSRDLAAVHSATAPAGDEG